MDEKLTRIADLVPPLMPGERTLQPSALGRFISYDQCHRLFRLDLYDRSVHGELYRRTDSSPELLSPALSETGKRWERIIKEALTATGWFVRDLSDDRKPALDLAWQLADNSRGIVLQSELKGHIAGWSVTARPDLEDATYSPNGR